MNQDHLATPHIIGLAHIWTQLLDKLSKELEAWEIQPVYAAVFGSAARRSMSPRSDLDLFLVRQNELDEGQVAFWDAQVQGLAELVTRWTGNDTRPVQLAEREVEPGLPLLDSIRAEALTVYGDRAHGQGRAVLVDRHDDQ